MYALFIVFFHDPRLTYIQHPNIVKYKGFVKTKEYLYIILEYVRPFAPLMVSA